MTPRLILRLEGLAAAVAALTIYARCYVSGQLLVQQLALIWLAHIAIDRTLGFGLKYRTGFRDNHLTRL